MNILTSSEATAGTNAKASELNTVRADSLIKVYVFEVKHLLTVANGVAQSYLALGNSTVIGTKTKLSVGTATVRIKADSDTIDTINVTTTASDDISPADTTITEDQVLTLDVTAIGGNAEGLIVELVTRLNE